MDKQSNSTTVPENARKSLPANFHPSDIFYELSELHALLKASNAVLSEMSFAREDGSRNDELDQVYSLHRIAEREAERLTGLAAILDNCCSWFAEGNGVVKTTSSATPTAGGSYPGQPVQAFRDLEDDICRAHNMAVILDGALDTMSGQSKRGTQPIRLSNQEIEALAFAWKEVRNLTGTVMAKFYAVEAEVAQ